MTLELKMVDADLPDRPPAPELTDKEKLIAVQAYLESDEGRQDIHDRVLEIARSRTAPRSGDQAGAVRIPMESIRNASGLSGRWNRMPNISEVVAPRVALQLPDRNNQAPHPRVKISVESWNDKITTTA